MFDYSPSEDVPWFDGALARLYEYFDRVPEVWSDAAEFMKVRQQILCCTSLRGDAQADSAAAGGGCCVSGCTPGGCCWPGAVGLTCVL